MDDLRKAFFRTIIEAREALESENRSLIIRNIPTPEWLRSYREYVGMFLLGVEAITLKDYDLAGGMIESYEDRLDERGK